VSRANSVAIVDGARPSLIRLAIPPAAFAAILAASITAQHAGVSVGFCLMRELVGVRCLGCGITTSIVALLLGSFAAAFAANVAGPAVVGVFIAQLAGFVAAWLQLVPQQTSLRWARSSDRALLISLLIGWFSHYFIY
jgi:hypothetical protein